MEKVLDDELQFEEEKIAEKFIEYLKKNENNEQGFYVSKDGRVAIDVHINEWVNDGEPLTQAGMTKEEALKYYSEEHNDEIFDSFFYIFTDIVGSFSVYLDEFDIMPSEFYSYLVNYGFGVDFNETIDLYQFSS